MCAAYAQMLPELDFSEAIKDSPRFRQALAGHEQFLNKLDTKLNELLRLLNAVTDHGKDYTCAFHTLSVAINQLCQEVLPDNARIKSAVEAFSESFTHVIQLQRTFIEESYFALRTNIFNFLRNERWKVLDSRVQFESLSNSLDDALIRKSSICRTRTSELIDAKNALTAVGTCFAHTALDYVAHIKIAHARKDHVILDVLWSFVKECSSFFARGHAFFDEWTAMENGSISQSVSAVSAACKYTERKMQDRHILVPKEVFQQPLGMSLDNAVIMEGYLFKRATNAFKTWHRRWFQIMHKQLIYCHRSANGETPTVMEADLKLCLVRPAPSTVERAHCFELITPSRCHLLQADSEISCNAWIRALQRTIHYLHEMDENYDINLAVPIDGVEGMSIPAISFTEPLLMELMRVPGNEVCADCGAQSPKWSSISFGILLCIECCAIHRSFGVQMSRVRSLTMDCVESEQRKLLLALGNDTVNSVYLADLPTANIIPLQCRPTSSRIVREAWIRAKYVHCRFVMKPASYTEKYNCFRKVGRLRFGPSHNLYRSISLPSFRVATFPSPISAAKRFQSCQNTTKRVLTKSTSVDGESDSHLSSNLFASDVFADAMSDGKRVLKVVESGELKSLIYLIAEGIDITATFCKTTALHVASKLGDGVITEFLLLNGAKLNALDASLNTPLHVASSNAHTLIVCQLMRRGADQRIRNRDGKTPLDVAVDGKHADIVTLLRLQKMRNEFNGEFNNPMDETVDGIMLDISRKADPSQR